MKKILFIIIIALIVAGVWWQATKNTTEDEFCIQVITDARNPETQEIKSFPTPCDVPENWEIIM